MIARFAITKNSLIKSKCSHGPVSGWLQRMVRSFASQRSLGWLISRHVKISQQAVV
jgi:hypothetical protein